MGKFSPGYYEIENRETGEIYVGSASSLPDRLSQHKRNLNNNSHHNEGLAKAFNSSAEKVFENVFEVRRFKTESREEAYNLEQSSIDRLKDSGRLLNLAMNARNPGIGRRASEHEKRLASERAKGRAVTEEAKQKLSKAHTGKTLSPEHRAKVSAYWTGRPKSPEHAEKVAATKRIKVIEDGITYQSVTAYAEAKGISVATASRRAKKLRGE